MTTVASRLAIAVAATVATRATRPLPVFSPRPLSASAVDGVMDFQSEARPQRYRPVWPEAEGPGQIRRDSCTRLTGFRRSAATHEINGRRGLDQPHPDRAANRTRGFPDATVSRRTHYGDGRCPVSQPGHSHQSRRRNRTPQLPICRLIHPPRAARNRGRQGRHAVGDDRPRCGAGNDSIRVPPASLSSDRSQRAHRSSPIGSPRRTGPWWSQPTIGRASSDSREPDRCHAAGEKEVKGTNAGRHSESIRDITNCHGDHDPIGGTWPGSDPTGCGWGEPHGRQAGIWRVEASSSRLPYGPRSRRSGCRRHCR